MEHLPGGLRPGAGELCAASSVQGVAEYGVAEVLEVDADLVGASGFDLDFEVGGGAVGESGEHFPVCEGGACGEAMDGAAFAVLGMAAEGEVDGAVGGVGDAVDEGLVGFVDLAVAELVLEVFEGGGGAGEEDDAAGICVEAVDEAGAHGVADTSQVGIWGEEGVDQGAVGVSGGGMHDEACGFIDDQEVWILPQDFEGDFFGFGGSGLGNVQGVHVNVCLGGQGFAGFERGSVAGDCTGMKPGLNLAAGVLGEVLGQPFVGADFWRVCSGKKKLYFRVLVCHRLGK